MTRLTRIFGRDLGKPLANAVVFFFHEKLWRRIALPGLPRATKAQPAAA